MTQSVTGVGQGSCDKLTVKELTILANGPSILVSGRVDLSEDFPVNPPSPTANVVLSQPLPGSCVNYVVQVTGLNVGLVYVAEMSDDGNGNFYSFRLIGDNEGTCMYSIIPVGFRPVV